MNYQLLRLSRRVRKSWLAAPPQFGSGNAWARYRITPAALIRLATLAILGIFVLHGVWNARTVGTAIMAFVAGCLGLGGLVLLSKAYVSSQSS